MKIDYRTSVGRELMIIAGPCVIENEKICLEIAGFMKKLCASMGLPYVFKASFDKANRSSGKSFRGLGMKAGLKTLGKIGETLEIPLLTDIHEAIHAEETAEVVDILQIPAFLCRQTNLLEAAGKTGKTVNIKKGQFMAPEDMKGAVDKVRATGNNNVMLTERGSSFGYHNLIVDMRSLVIMKGLGVPVVFDATHSVQLPGGLGHASGGQRQFVRPLAMAAAAVGIDALFLEVHPDPEKALSDGPNTIALADVAEIIKTVNEIYELQRKSL